MKKFLLAFLILFVLFPIYAQYSEAERSENQNETTAADKKAPRPALFSEGSFFLSGGVKTGILIRNRDFGGALNTLASSEDLTLHFASYENNARNGEAWFNVGYSGAIERICKFGLQIGMWAHGDIKSFDDALHIGDHFLWANFFDDRLRFIGGQGGGTPISSGGWIGADWLGYTGLRLFWVDPIGISVGIIFPDPDEYGIKPVNYLSLLGAGISYKHKNWWISAQFDNSPIYDDSESNYYGGLHRPDEQDPIAQAGNLAVSFGIENLYKGKGHLVIEAMVNNLGEDEEEGRGDYTISPVSSTFALKTGWPITDAIYLELKGKYTMKQGDAPDFTKATQAVYWGKLEFEPYFCFQPFSHLAFELAFYGAIYINSYYLALDASPTSIPFKAGQVPGHPPLLDYLSPYELSIKPKISLKLPGIDIGLGYAGTFSRDHVKNIIYIDFRWMF